MQATTITASTVDRRSAPASSAMPQPPGVICGEELLRRYEVNGGLVSGDHLAWLMSERVDQAISVVARWIISHRVVSLRPHGQLLLPWFQFDRQRLQPCPEVSEVIAVLRERWDDGELAAWFVTRHPMLQGQWPLQVLRADTAAVLRAARAA